MIVKDLEGNESTFCLTQKNKSKRSKLHQGAVMMIKGVVPGIIIREDISVRIKPGLTLYLDIYLPSLQIIVEIHGRQHYEYVPYFHKSESRYGRSKLNDALKKEWCQLNKFGFVELAYDRQGDWEREFRTAIRRYTGLILS